MPLNDSADVTRQAAKLSLGTDASVDAVVGVLNDPDCRRLLAHLGEPRTAGEVGRQCNLPRSTTYRKLGQLSDVGLLEERHRIRSDGNRVTRYVRAVERLHLGLESGSLSLTVE
jgi:DNA-binding transcriptional ArsR family regulator